MAGSSDDHHSRAHAVALQFARAAAEEIEYMLGGQNIEDDILVEPHASEKGHPFVYIEAGDETLDRLKISLNYEISLGGETRTVEVFLKGSTLRNNPSPFKS